MTPGEDSVTAGSTRRPANVRAGSGSPGTGAEGFVTIDGERFYRISGYHRMPPFLMGIASDADLWMFVSSRGALTAGRVDPDGALFPYETVDKLHDAHHPRGPITLVRVEDGGASAAGGTGVSPAMWEPFADATRLDPRIERNLYKSVCGNQVVFEELHTELEMAIRMRWSACDAFGLVRTVSIENRSRHERRLRVMDGLRNILPFGAPLILHQQLSSLVNAYKRTDLDPGTGLATYSLTSKIIDRAEAAESLRANTVWQHGLEDATFSLSPESLDTFRGGANPAPETILTGRRGNYFASAALELAPGESASWHVCADVGRSHIDVAALHERLHAGGDIGGEIEAGIAEAQANLVRNVASADGLQLTASEPTTVHHFANVLFNNMRGGVFVENNDIPTGNFVEFLRVRNQGVASRQADWLATLPESIPVASLVEAAAETGDADLRRLCYEYLPIHFGRRHGDPSRPWNYFSVRVKNADGSRALDYQGNWRDVFQNWEALCMSFPAFIPNVIARFVNASTVDGFNPYRIMRDGIDWEVVDPDDPWSYIGYWGDHQIIYLLKFLEALPRFAPGVLEEMLGAEVFSYADVPYRLKPYEAILENPDDTVEYDHDRAAAGERRVSAIGGDGKLLHGDSGVYHVTLLEKLLVPVLSKLSNFVPGGGIWMNTQRPEWNDANNALVGNGVSMVTLYYLRRHLAFLESALAGHDEELPVSTEVVEWFARVYEALKEAPPAGEVSDVERRRVMDELGQAFSGYRTKVYDAGFSGSRPLAVSGVVDLCGAALAHIDATIHCNRRADGLYHSYNLVTIGENDAAIDHLYEMLEGQVAVLSSGLVGPEEAADLIDALFNSAMYRKDQKSFMLYPARELPAFMERNVVGDALVEDVPLLGALLDAQDHSIVARDATGTVRFQGDFQNADDLAAALDRLAADSQWAPAVQRDRRAVLGVFEAVFNHHAFTGRSGTMYAYEGLGSIYWHMVAKLLLAVQEVGLRAASASVPDPAVVQRLMDAYVRIRGGLGFEKTAAEYGAFPTDPYSHTPAHTGAQQPGMTGQVKEEILTRFGELGIRVEGGCVRFEPVLLTENEFLDAPASFRYYDVHGEVHTLDLPTGSLAFTFCQVPVIYRRTDGEPSTRVARADGTSSDIPGNQLDAGTSAAVFDRAGAISTIEVRIAGVLPA